MNQETGIYVHYLDNGEKYQNKSLQGLNVVASSKEDRGDEEDKKN